MEENNNRLEELSTAPEKSGEGPQPKEARLPSRSKFHSYPKEWDKSIAKSNTDRFMNAIHGQANFHLVALQEVRKALGKRCTHLIHVTDKSGIITFRAKLTKDGIKKTVNVESELQAHELDAESYRNLNDTLLNELRN